MLRLLTLILPFALLLCACSDSHRNFCQQATAKLCDRCESCGDFKACGLMRANDRETCVTSLQNVCAAYDSVYSAEVARSCLEQLDALSCDVLKTSGKPDACTKLF